MILLPTKLQRAINYAAQAHGDQLRKSLNVPYIIHPTVVAMILSGYDYNTDTCVVGALHDVIEDTNVTYSKLKRDWETSIADDVQELSEDKSLTWEERKKNGIKKVKSMSAELLAVKAADAISNMTDLLATYEVKKEATFKDFTRGKSDTILRYVTLCKAIKEVTETYVIYNRLSENQLKIFEELQKTVDSLVTLF